MSPNRLSRPQILRFNIIFASDPDDEESRKANHGITVAMAIRIPRVAARNVLGFARAAPRSSELVKRPLTRCFYGWAVQSFPAKGVEKFRGELVVWPDYWAEGSFWRVRSASTSASAKAVAEDVEGHCADQEKKSAEEPPERAVTEISGKERERLKEEGKLVHSSYWGILSPARITREDGSSWPWNSFRPWETYSADLSIDLTKHHVPKTAVDKIAYWTVKALRVPTDLFFKRRYGCRAMMLETVAAVPGMVGGMLLHCKSIRKFQYSGGWIKALLEEAENERMHLMTFMEVAKPKWYERAIVFVVQGLFFNTYFLLYLISPKLAHRIVGYLEEEAIHSYTEFLKDLDNGNIPNVPAPAIAIDYWRLPKDATLRDVVMVVRADEAHHRDVNHFASDIYFQGKELREAAAPLDYR